MESTVVEIRQPYSMPVGIAVPLYPRLEKLATQLKTLNEEALTAAGEIASLSQEKVGLDREAQLVTATSETFSRLAEVRLALTRFEALHGNAKAQATRVSEELGELRHEYAWHFYRRGLLNSELAQAAQQPVMRTYNPGERPRRPLIEVLTELFDCVRWLAIWTGDPKLAEELKGIETKLMEARQQ